MDDDLIRTFEAGLIPEGGFRHADHVRVAWCYLSRYPLTEALARFSAALRGFAAARGTPDLYHATITIAYVLLINERLDAEGREQPWPIFASRNPDLLAWRPSVLERYYLPDTLWSERARRTFVMPDRLAP